MSKALESQLATGTKDVRLEGEGCGVETAWEGVMCGGLGQLDGVGGGYISGWKDERKHFRVWEHYRYL